MLCVSEHTVTGSLYWFSGDKVQYRLWYERKASTQNYDNI